MKGSGGVDDGCGALGAVSSDVAAIRETQKFATRTARILDGIITG